METKPAWLWVIIDEEPGHGGPVSGDLVFSTPAKCQEILGWWDARFQIVEIQVPIGFTDWDYIPDNY